MNRTRIFLEDYIEEMYKSIGILTLQQLNIDTISERLGITVMYMARPSMQVGNTIVIDSGLTDEEKWQVFCHELCHIQWHSVNQRVMSKLYLEYQEWKAESFALYACIPSFILDQIDLPVNKKEAVWEIHDTFNVELSFAEERLEKWLQQHEGHLFHQKITRELAK